jgi:hypothetical protein
LGEFSRTETNPDGSAVGVGVQRPGRQGFTGLYAAYGPTKLARGNPIGFSPLGRHCRDILSIRSHTKIFHGIFHVAYIRWNPSRNLPYIYMERENVNHMQVIYVYIYTYIIASICIHGHPYRT